MDAMNYFSKSFSEEELDMAECLIKRERPDLWTNLTRPSPSQMNNTNFYDEFRQLVSSLDFINELLDVTALGHSLYDRGGRLS